jgi:DNA modification methylase
MSQSPLDKLRANPRNPRTITPEKATMLRNSLEKFGDLGGIVLNVAPESGQIVGGHQRVVAFREAASVEEHIEKRYDQPTKTGTVAEGYLLVDGERFSYRHVHWDKNTEMAANLSANRQAGEFLYEEVDRMLAELENAEYDPDLTMFSQADREEPRDDTQYETPTKPDSEPVPAELVQDVEHVEPPAEPTSVRGATYKLGRHTLHCGDSTQHPAKHLSYDVVFTDPPYGVNYRARSTSEKKNQYGQIKNDGITGELLQDVVRKAIPDAPYKFICCDWKAFSDFEKALGRPQSVCVWDKGHFGFGKGYRRQHEFIMFYGEHNRSDLSDMWPFKRASNYEHPTQKPVPLIAKALADVAAAGAKVYDCFGGSGSTLLAAEQLGMVATLVEYEPKYCDVIISRYERLTGEKAVKL